MIGIEEIFWRCLLDDLRELPSQVHCILHSDVEALSTHRRMHVRGVAGEQHAPVAICRCLARYVGEARNPGRTVDPVIGAVHGDERLADIAQSGFAVECSVASVNTMRADLPFSILPMPWKPSASW